MADLGEHEVVAFLFREKFKARFGDHLSSERGASRSSSTSTRAHGRGPRHAQTHHTERLRGRRGGAPLGSPAQDGLQAGRGGRRLGDRHNLPKMATAVGYEDNDNEDLKM